MYLQPAFLFPVAFRVAADALQDVAEQPDGGRVNQQHLLERQPESPAVRQKTPVMLDQREIYRFEKSVVPVAQPVAGRTLGRGLLKPKVIQLATHTTQTFTYFRHRVATAQDAEKHCNQLCHAAEWFVITVALLLAYDAFDIDSCSYFHDLFQNRLSDKIYFPIFTHVVVSFAKTNLQHLGVGLKQAYSFFILSGQ